MATTLGVRDEFVNTTTGWIGVVQIGPHGEQKGIAVAPGMSVWLTEDEQILTANAPVRDEDNPFTNGQLELRTQGAQIKNRRPYGAQAGGPLEAPAEETGATPTPESEPELGETAPGEEVATPEATTAGRRRRA